MLKRKFDYSTRSRAKSGGQVILEFTFCMIVLFFMIYGVIMVFRWTGVDLAERRRAHMRVLKGSITKDWTDIHDGPIKQIKPYFFDAAPLNAVKSPY
jgi:hypothetical protein